MLPALERLLDEHRSGDIHVVASGDPLLHGIGATLIRLHGADRVRVLPHVSSVTLACARMGWNVQDTEVISLVTAPVHTAVRRGGQAVVLSRDGSTPGGAGHGYSPKPAAVHRNSPCSSISAVRGSGSAPAAPTPGRQPPLTSTISTSSRSATCPTTGSATTLPDDAFAHDGQITKQTVRAVTLAALAPRPGRAAVGCRFGFGQHRRGVVPQRTGVPGGGVRGRTPTGASGSPPTPAPSASDIDVRGEAPGDFDGAPKPDAIFIGGGLTNTGLVQACIDRLPAGGRLVANAVTAESEALAGGMAFPPRR